MSYQYTACPVCAGKEFVPFLRCKDYTVSGESFGIESCKDCGFKLTNPRPENERLGAYYQSENYISHSNTRKGLISKVYHAVRKHTLKRKIDLVGQYVSRGTILDYGCGTGAFMTVAHEAGWKTFGLEPDKGARKMAFESGLNVSEDKQVLDQKSKDLQFNAITLWHVLEHVTDLSETLSFFRKKLLRDGVLFIAVPNHLSHDAQHYGEFWAAYDVPRHLYHFEPGTIVKLLSEHGFKHLATHPMKFDSFYVSMLSEKYKTGSIRYISAFLEGLRSNLRARGTGDYSSLIYVFQ